ncbi:hypothetical protein [Lysinibacillus piscis]|uniref:Multidrug transporter n=1 Tax=Lysinibacillus piscis TaxID=2518931 RepID=A0ABQ5NGA7_9BACI|nr:hypothetical protein [Lysinibacillus sp. KH24]GLC87376.1 hypothetical protein LYSBPC_05030 [Lysinibacillus sp. KH24]
MFGSIFYNLWGALIAFSIYFFSTFYKPFTPLRVLIGASVAAVITFLAMYIVRFVIAYILFTPEDSEELEDTKLEESKSDKDLEESKESIAANSTIEFQDEDSEEIAQVVRTMMHREDEPQIHS